MKPGGTGNVAADRGNLAVIAAMSLLWITPVLRFWGAALGPLRPHGYPAGDFAPSPGWFAAGLAVCFAPCLLPAAFYGCWEGGRGMRLYEAAGVRVFRRFATNGDLINRFARRLDPRYRAVRGRDSARRWAENTRAGERGHLVLLVAGALSAAYAARIGWNGWALGLAAGNLVFNLYPALLQRYTRCRIARVFHDRRACGCPPSPLPSPVE